MESQNFRSSDTSWKGFRILYPRVDKDLFIFAASFKRSPSAPELFCLLNLGCYFALKFCKKYFLCTDYYLSDPARSTKFNLPNLRWVIESFSQQLSMIQVKTLWERLLSLFIRVAAIFLFALPCVNENVLLSHITNWKEQTSPQCESPAVKVWVHHPLFWHCTQ